MSKIIAIITEYNPFHNGHKYQIDRIRAENEDATIIAIMSGNVVQRGEFAFLDKYARAEMAKSCGVDAVFELPYPYSGSTAEMFAHQGVKIAYNLGAQVLYFGTESRDIAELEKIAEIIDSDAFENEIRKILNAKEISFPALREQALENLGFKLSRTSNDMLALEYIRQIKNNGYKMEYRSIERVGAGYNNTEISSLMSASGIRKEFYESKQILSVPDNAKAILDIEISNGKINEIESAKKMLYQYAIMASAKQIESSFDCPVGLGYYITQKAKEAKNHIEFFESLSSKTYTTARVKRTLLYSFFGIKSVSKQGKCYTILLSANKKGTSILKRIKTNEKLVVLTKHSDAKKLNVRLYKQYLQLKRVDEIYQSLFYEPNDAANAYKQTVKIEK